MKAGIGKPLFVTLLMQFCEDKGYTIYHDGKKLEFQSDFSSLLRRLYLFAVAVTVASGRVALSRSIELEYALSKRKEGQSILRFRPHSSLVRHLREHPELAGAEHDLSFDALLEQSYKLYNSFVDMQDTKRDSIIFTNNTKE